MPQKEQKSYQKDKKSFLIIEAILSITIISISFIIILNSQTSFYNYFYIFYKSIKFNTIFYKANYNLDNQTLAQAIIIKNIDCYKTKLTTKLYISTKNRTRFKTISCFKKIIFDLEDNKTEIYYYN